MSNQRGFTLIELLVVISIIGFLSSVILSGTNLARIKARNALRIANANSIANGLYVATTGTTNQFPDTADFKCLGKATCWVEMLDGRYIPGLDTLLKKGMAGGVIPLDPIWKTPDSGDAFLYYGWGGDNGIIWRMEDDGNADQPCGKGYSLGRWFIPDDGSWTCVLILSGANL